MVFNVDSEFQFEEKKTFRRFALVIFQPSDENPLLMFCLYVRNESSLFSTFLSPSACCWQRTLIGVYAQPMNVALRVTVDSASNQWAGGRAWRQRAAAESSRAVSVLVAVVLRGGSAAASMTDFNGEKWKGRKPQLHAASTEIRSGGKHVTTPWSQLQISALSG